MSTEYKRMRQLIGTTADWTADNLVLARGELGVELRVTGFQRLKIGDGTTPFLQLPYLEFGAPAVDLTGYATEFWVQAQYEARILALEQKLADVTRLAGGGIRVGGPIDSSGDIRAFAP